MNNESNITSKVIVAATITASCYGVNYDFTDGTNSLPTRDYPYEFVDNNYKKLSDKLSDQGTATIYWSQNNFQEFDKQEFTLDYNSPHTMEIAEKLFKDSDVLDEVMSKILVETIARIGKDKTELPNRL